MKYKLCQPLLCHVQLRHLDVVIVDDHHGVALNTIDFDFKHKQLCIVNHGTTFHHFHFSTHNGEKPIFSSFPLRSQKASSLSHRGETTPAYPQFGKPCTISDILFLFSRYYNHIGKKLERKESERDVV